MERFISLKSADRQRLIHLLPLLIILLAAVVRFHLIDHQSLWNDEGNTLRLVERTIPDLIANAARDIHPPGYYLLLKGWRLLTGESEFALRAFSALAGMLTVACVYALGRTLFARGVGIAAAIVVTLNSFNVYYSQEARMYALLALLASASMLVFVRWLQVPRINNRSWWLALVLALINAAGLYTQYTYPFVMVTQGLLFILLWWRKRDLRLLGMYIALNLITLALFAPQLPTALHQITAWPRTGQPVPFMTGLATVAQWLIYGNTISNLGPSSYLWPVIFIMAALLPDWRTMKQPSWWRRLVPLLWLLLTVVPLFGLGLFREANLKFLLPAQLATALLIGRGMWFLWEIGSGNMAVLLEALPRLVAAAGFLSVVSMLSTSLNNLYTDTTYARPDYRTMAQNIMAAPRPGDAIILDAPNQSEVFTYYYHGSAPIYQLPEGLGGDDAKTAQTVNQVISQHRRIFVLYWGETERDPNRIVEKTLATSAFEARSAWYGDVRFVQYATLPIANTQPLDVNAQFGDAITLQSAALSANQVQAGDVLGVTLKWTTSQALSTRYKVFVQVLNSDGQLVAQHDSEPGNNMALTTTWKPGEIVDDSHGVLMPLTAVPGSYTVIVGLYDANNPQNRLKVGKGDYLTVGSLTVVR